MFRGTAYLLNPFGKLTVSLETTELLAKANAALLRNDIKAAQLWYKQIPKCDRDAKSVIGFSYAIKAALNKKEYFERIEKELK